MQIQIPSFDKQSEKSHLRLAILTLMQHQQQQHSQQVLPISSHGIDSDNKKGFQNDPAPFSFQDNVDTNSFALSNEMGLIADASHSSSLHHQGNIAQTTQYGTNGVIRSSPYQPSAQEYIGSINNKQITATSSEAGRSSSSSNDDEEDNDNFDDDGEDDEDDEDDNEDEDEDDEGGKSTRKNRKRKKRGNGSVNDDESDYENDGDGLSSPRGTHPRKRQSGERHSSSSNSKIRRGNWSKEEDKMLLDAIATYDFDWKMISLAMGGRTSKQCRDRYKLKLDPSINHGPWTKEEDIILLRLHEQFGRQWTKIASALPGRTENSVKTRFSSLIKLKSKEWTEEEDLKLREARKTEMPFSDIAARILPNRSEHAVKKRWEQLFMRDLAQKIREELPPNLASAAAPKMYPPSTQGSPNSAMSPTTPSARIEVSHEALVNPMASQQPGNNNSSNNSHKNSKHANTNATATTSSPAAQQSNIYIPQTDVYSSDTGHLIDSFQSRNSNSNSSASLTMAANFDHASYPNNTMVDSLQDQQLSVDTEFPPPSTSSSSAAATSASNNASSNTNAESNTNSSNGNNNFQPPTAQPRRTSQRLQRHSTSMTVLLQLLGDQPGS